MSTLVERLEELAAKEGVCGQSDVRRIAFLEAAAALRATTGEGEWEYYYRQSDCPAADNAAADCVCWHPEGTGPFANEQHDAMDSTLEWRRAAAPTPAECWQHRPGSPCPNPTSCRDNGCNAVERELFPTPAEPLRDSGAVTDTEIEQGWRDTFSTENPYCPCDLKSFTKAVRWALRNTHPAPAQVDERMDRLRKYYEVTQNGIGIARMALMMDDAPKAKAALDRMCDEIDAALAAAAKEGKS